MIEVLRHEKVTRPLANKADLEARYVTLCNPIKQRSVFIGNGYALRFSEANTGSFSNVVLSLSALQKYDSTPLVICIVRPDRLNFRLANSTFLKRVSHSSHQLRTDNIRGSFLGHDIFEHYDGIENSPENFDQLFAIHQAFTWEENVERLVEATNSIVARSTRFGLSEAGLARLMNSPARAAAALITSAYQNTERSLSAIVTEKSDQLLAAVTLDNVNLRGNAIEKVITGARNAHRLDDLVFSLETGGRHVVDIKTKLLDRASAPKAYNINKLLTLLAEPDTVFSFFFIGLDSRRGIVRSRLVSIFDPVILAATRIQTHWAGRASRGVTQLTGDLTRIFDPAYRPTVEIDAAMRLLRQFVER